MSVGVLIMLSQLK